MVINSAHTKLVTVRRFTFDLHEGADGRTYVRTVDDVMAIKPNFLASMGYQYFLRYGAPRSAKISQFSRLTKICPAPEKGGGAFEVW